jgi:hypothetical protein
MKWFKRIGRDGTKMAWIAVVLIVAAAFTGLWLLPIAATKWRVLVQFKDNIYSLIEKLINIVWLPIANEIRKAFEKKYGLPGDNSNPPDKGGS